MKHRTPIHVLCTTACIALTGSAAHAAQVYLETFDNPGPDAPLSDYGWSALVTESGSISNYGTQSRAIGGAAGDYGFYAPKADDNAPWTAAVVNDPALASTTAPGTIDITDLTSIAWDSSADNADHAFRVAIQIGGAWYASSTALNDGVEDSGTTGFVPLSYSPASFATAANWLSIQNTTVGNAGTLSLGAAPASDLSGDVTAFGLYLVAGIDNEANGDHVRWDNFEINAVPEPSVAALGLIAMAGLLRRRRA